MQRWIARFADHLPPLLRASWLRCVLATAALAAWSVVMLLDVFLWRDASGPFSMPSMSQFRAVQGVLLLAFVAAIIDYRVRRRRIRSTLRDSGGLACGHCGHSLRMVNASGACPECGKAFDLGRLYGYWERFFAPRWRDPPPMRFSRAPISGAMILVLMFAWGMIMPTALSRTHLPFWTGLGNLLLASAWMAPILGLLWWILFVSRKRGIARRAWLANLNLCGRCGQVLVGDHDPIACRVCGTKYARAALHAAWERDCPAHWSAERQDA